MCEHPGKALLCPKPLGRHEHVHLQKGESSSVECLKREIDSQVMPNKCKRAYVGATMM
jgi:hypothetical protein